MRIIGAGLAGCIAAMVNPRATIVEPKAKNDMTIHRALLRFRSEHIGDAIGIPFKKIQVHKGIWHKDGPVPLSPRYINLYSRKVSDKISNRSIIDLETRERFVAPEDLHEQLLEILYHRIAYGVPVEECFGGDDVKVSTLPMFVTSKVLNEPIRLDSHVNKIYISRYRVRDCNVYQTYYYTHPTMAPYRASISGDVLIIESMWELKFEDVKKVMDSFGLTGLGPNMKAIVENYQQPNGKISKIDEAARRRFILNLTRKHNVFSLGRFATWRNLVLDDVYKDAHVIKRLITQDDYNRSLYDES